MNLDSATFQTIINSTPLISIDIAVCDSYGRFLLGKRLNRPAKGFYFFPGGRIRKNESMPIAFKRICKTELNIDASITEAEFLGAFEHFYNDTFFSSNGTTHYIALGYVYKSKSVEFSFPLGEQHSKYKWLSMNELLSHNLVHPYTKNYFETIRVD